MNRILTLFITLTICMESVSQNDIDTHIAVNETTDNNTFVVIIANENYKHEQSVPFAINDGETFKLYCEKTLGIPNKNIRYVADATLNEMRIQLQWLQNVMKAYNGDARAILYYSGHGMPDEDSKQAYLLPVDGNSTLPASGMSTASLYKELGALPSVGTIVLLDACFSGARRDGKMLAASRGVAIKTRDESLQGNMVVFSAAQAGETAFPLAEKRHGTFTYYILEQLQENGGCISLGDLCDYVTKQVGRCSIVENNKSQTPTLVASSSASDWRKWLFCKERAKIFETVNRKPSTDYNSKPDSSQRHDQKQILENLINNMVFVKGGSYMMGFKSSYDLAVLDSLGDTRTLLLNPILPMETNSFRIGKYEVTQEEWVAVMGSNPSSTTGDKLPVDNVSWIDCQHFIQKLNQLTEMRFRLPSEAEWEYAARGGNLSKNYEYAGSDTKEEVAWCMENSEDVPHPVGQKQANELGLHDMSGNVSEWCQDYYNDYHYYTEHHISKGGDCSTPTYYVYDHTKLWYRVGIEANAHCRHQGLRLAL